MELRDKWDLWSGALYGVCPCLLTALTVFSISLDFMDL